MLFCGQTLGYAVYSRTICGTKKAIILCITQKLFERVEENFQFGLALQVHVAKDNNILGDAATREIPQADTEVIFFLHFCILYVL